MYKYLNLFFILLIGFLSTPDAKATHAMGGDITWSCLGNGQYVFELKFYRDCNGFDVNVNHEQIQVWGHPNLTNIEAKYVRRDDISPQCTAAAGFSPFECGVGTSGGNGVGAVEEVTYRSDPVTIIGTPPPSGWHFTFQNFSRSSHLTNIQSPTTVGITISATMYPIPGATGGCIDNSPIFLQSPYIVSCTGDEYRYNPNAVDPDLDSLVFSWGEPLDYFPTGSFSPPTNPSPVAFISGYSFDNPTPDQNFNPNNQPAVLDSETGNIIFTSYTEGNFATKVIVDSYRNGVKIASIERETQLIVNDCLGNNGPPTITLPFAGSTIFETEYFAGDLINFNISATDNDLLQDGSPQSVTISSTGLMYGTNFTDPNNGCSTTPCATLDAPTITAQQNATLGFTWQTSCDHLVDATGNAQSTKPYIFVFKVQDDYCEIPKVRYVTLKITLKNKDVLPGPNLKCVTTEDNGDITISWDPITDPFGTFNSYKINNADGTNIGTVNNINTDTYTIVGGLTQAEDLFISTMSGCDGLTARNSDTLSNIFLEIDNPGDGRAHLKWNHPHNPVLASFGSDFQIFKEYPMGTWQQIGTVPYGSTHFFDTITICSDWINYKVVLPSPDCDFTSNIAGDIFEDKIVPDMPVITNVGYDTISGEMVLTWNENSHSDTYGYVIYITDGFGNVIPIDTIWGKGNTTYTHTVDPENGVYQYSVAAFDSCYTTNVPPTYQTSAKADQHSTIFLDTHVDICSRLLRLNWTNYIGFNVSKYIIHTRTNGQNWEIKGETNSTSYDLDIIAGEEIIVTIEAVSQNGVYSFSNIDTAAFEGTIGPDMSYLSVATVGNNKAVIKYRITPGEAAKYVQLERYNDRLQDFERIDQKTIGNQDEIIFIDTEAEVNRRSYTYRAKVIDTCNHFISYSNIGTTIYLNIITSEENETHTLQWTPYNDFKGNLQQYEIYRSVDGIFELSAIAILSPENRTYVDDISQLGNYSVGKVCYKVLAVEGGVEYAHGEMSVSNTACGVLSPIVYIPNAFTVGGKNPVFRPQTRAHQIDDFLLEIYDRYGRIIFSTTDPEEGWDGRLVGQTRIAREGVYIYRLALRDGDGIEVVRHGHVTLLDYRRVE